MLLVHKAVVQIFFIQRFKCTALNYDIKNRHKSQSVLAQTKKCSHNLPTTQGLGVTEMSVEKLGPGRKVFGFSVCMLGDLVFRSLGHEYVVARCVCGQYSNRWNGCVCVGLRVCV